MISIILVDDHKIVRDGIKAFTLGSDKVKVINEAANADELFEVLKTNLPDIVVLDIAMPGLSGIEITKQLLQRFPSVNVLILSANDTESTVIEAIEAGACGFLSKDSSKEEFYKAIDAVHNSEGYFGEKISNIIYKSYVNKIKSTKSPETIKKDLLSERELEVIKLFSEGLSFKEIAHALNISPRTVETHKNNILEKLELKNTIELVKYAIKQGIIQL